LVLVVPCARCFSRSQLAAFGGVGHILASHHQQGIGNRLA
jgi:hypothetical protein